jgi:hypothetical protein
MAFITFEGTASTNQYLSPLSNHILLTHPDVTDSLILCEHDDKPYESYPTGWAVGDGRSLLGSIRVRGSNWLKNVWEFNFICTPAQATLFNSLLDAQQDTVNTVELVDNWQSTPITKDVWIQTDRQYLTTIGLEWRRLQFQLLEV